MEGREGALVVRGGRTSAELRRRLMGGKLGSKGFWELDIGGSSCWC